MFQKKLLAGLLAFMTLCALAFGTTSPALASNGGGKAPHQPAEPTSPKRNSTVTPYSNSSTCVSSPSASNCDGYDPAGSNCNSSNGAYILGGDASYLRMYWSPKCQSNYFYVTGIPSGLMCGTMQCNVVERVEIYRNTSSGNYCNANVITCINFSNGGRNLPNECYWPGTCPTNTELTYCHAINYGVCDDRFFYNGPVNGVYYSGRSFNQEGIGAIGVYYESWETDLLYAPSETVMACVWYEGVPQYSTGGPPYIQRCTQWH